MICDVDRCWETRWCWSPRVELNFIGTTAALIAGGLSAAGAIGGSALASKSAGKAADTQANAATEAAKINAASQDKALAEQRRQFDTQQGNLAPWLSAGKSGLSTLQDLLNQANEGKGALAPWTGTFKPPTTAELTDSNNPQYAGYQFILDQGKKAIESSAAAKGGLYSGGTGQALANFAEKAGAQYSDDAYGQAMQRYLQSYNEFNNNSTNTYNRYAAMAGVGLQATQQADLSSANEAHDVGNIFMTGGANAAQLAQQAGAARASGYASSGNIWGSTLGNLGELPLTLQMLLNKGGSAPGYGMNGGVH